MPGRSGWSGASGLTVSWTTPSSGRSWERCWPISTTSSRLSCDGSSYRVGARADKWILKQAARPHIPADIIARPKAGFPLPTGEFIAPLLAPELFDAGFVTGELGVPWGRLNGELERGRRGERDAFDLLTLELWGRLFIRGESLDEVEARVAGLEP